MTGSGSELQQLLIARMRELGEARGRPLSLNELHGSLPPDGDWVTREAVRRVLVDGHTNIGPRAVRTIATMFRLPEAQVLRASGKRVPLGRFELPEEADRLTASERRAVLAVVYAILDAGEPPADGVTTRSETPSRPLRAANPSPVSGRRRATPPG